MGLSVLLRLREGVQEKHSKTAALLPVTCWLLAVTLLSPAKGFVMELLLCFILFQGVLAADTMWFFAVITTLRNLVKEYMDSS